MSVPKLKVLILVRSFDAGGAERQLLELLRSLDTQRFDVRVATFYRGQWHAQAECVAGVSVVELGKAGRFDILRFSTRLYRVAKEFGPDVIYGYMSVPNVLAALLGRLLNVRVVWGIRNASIPQAERTALGHLLHWVARVLSRLPDVIVANSHAGARFYSDMGYPRSRFVVVTNGIDVSRYRRDDDLGRKCRERIGVPDKAKLLGCVSRVLPDKGHSDLFRAVALLESERLDFRVCLIGHAAPEWERRLRLLGEELGISDRLVWTGHVEELSEYYSAMDICVLPSRGEGFPNAIAEAMACETPCVGTDVGDVATLIGTTGAIVPANSVDELAGAIRALINADLRAMGRAARQRIETQFSVESMARGVTAVFERAATGTAP